MKKFKQILIIINLKTIIVTSLAVASTYLCRRFEITALKSLDNIQEHLESPFDQIGEDDIFIHAERFVERLELK